MTKCPQYISKTIQQRLAVIAKHQLYYNCLGSHRASTCRITKRCQKCGRKHHITIHQHNGTASETGINPEDSSATKLKSTEAHVLHAAGQPTTAIS